MYQKSAFRLKAIDGALALATIPGVAEPVALPRALADMLMSCSEFASIDQHAERIHRSFQLHGLPEADVRETLQEAAGRKLLVSRTELLDRLRALARSTDRVRIGSLGVVTRNRPESLVRCLRSYDRHLRSSARTLAITVADSTPPGAAGSVRAMLGALEAELGASVQYLGLHEKEALARRLSKAVDVDPETVDFALLGIAGQKHDAGANRNALLLAQSGRTALWTDDDMECEPRGPAEPRDRIALSAEEMPAGVTFHPSFAAARDSLVPRADSVLDLHELMLGRTVADGLFGVADCGIEIASLAPDMLASLLRGSARVVVSFAGYYGDAGVNYPAFHLWTSAAVLNQLPREAKAYRALVSSRDIARVARVLTVTGSGISMCGNVALDCRELLPPFFPNMRGEDLSFGRLLRSCSEDMLFSYVPQALAHVPWESRGRYDRLWSPATTLPMSASMIQLFDLAEASASVAAPGERRLRLIGRWLRELAALPAQDFQHILREQATIQISRTISRTERLLEQGYGMPDCWAADLRGYIEHHLTMLGNPHRGIPWELVAEREADHAAALFQQYVNMYGRLLEAWPELFRAAGTLEPALG